MKKYLQEGLNKDVKILRSTVNVSDANNVFMTITFENLYGERFIQTLFAVPRNLIMLGKLANLVQNESFIRMPSTPTIDMLAYFELISRNINEYSKNNLFEILLHCNHNDRLVLWDIWKQ